MSQYKYKRTNYSQMTAEERQKYYASYKSLLNEVEIPPQPAEFDHSATIVIDEGKCSTPS